MKRVEYLKTLSDKGVRELREELSSLRREQFSLRMQAGTGQLVKNNLIRDVRKKIAQVKTLMQQQVKA